MLVSKKQVPSRRRVIDIDILQFVIEVYNILSSVLTFYVRTKLSNRLLRWKREARFAFISQLFNELDQLANSQKIFAYRETRLSHTLVIVCNMINGYYYRYLFTNLLTNSNIGKKKLRDQQHTPLEMIQIYKLGKSRANQSHPRVARSI